MRAPNSVWRSTEGPTEKGATPVLGGCGGFRSHGLVSAIYHYGNWASCRTDVRWIVSEAYLVLGSGR